MTEDGETWGPQRIFKGYEAISEKVEGFHARMPGARLVLASGLNIFLNIARFKVAIVNRDGSSKSECQRTRLNRLTDRRANDLRHAY